jgi:prolipoprotein diacylglyceryltransferase
MIVPIGPWALRAFGVLALVGLGAAIGFTVRAAMHAGSDNVHRERAGVGDSVGVLGARATHDWDKWDYYLMHGSELAQLSADGLALWGGLACGAAAAWIALREYGRSTGHLQCRRA